MKKVLFPIMVYLREDKSRHNNRISFYLKFRDTTSQKIIKELGRRLDFYAYGPDDIESFTRAESERLKAQNEINENGYNPDVPDDFIIHCGQVIETKSKKSQGVFKCALNTFIDWNGNDSFPFKKLSTTTIDSYHLFLKEEYPEGNTPFTYSYKIKQFIDKAFEDGFIRKKIKVKWLSEESTSKDYLTEEEIELLENTPCNIPVVKKAFLFACYSGPRVSDWRRMQWGWFSRDADGEYILSFNMYKTKLPINNYVQTKAIEWLGIPGKKDEKVFPELEGLSYDDINKCLKLWMATAGIDKHITTHCARVSFATRVYLSTGGDILSVQKALGHKNVNTTQKYIRIPSKLFKDATLLKGLGTKPNHPIQPNDENDTKNAA
jgi:integrase